MERGVSSRRQVIYEQYMLFRYRPRRNRCPIGLLSSIT